MIVDYTHVFTLESHVCSTAVCGDFAKPLHTCVDPGMRSELFKMPNYCTCEPGRRSAYSKHLRWGIMWQREVLGYKYGQVASNLNVDVSTVWRIVKLFQETGCVDKKMHPKQRAFRKLTTPLQPTVLHLVLERPGIYLRDIHSELFELAGADISYSQMCRFLSDMGFSRQKIKYPALQRDQRLRFL